MSNAIFRVPNPTNEQVRPYLPGSDESKSLILTYRRMYAEQVDIPLYIGNKEIRTNA
jgi:1-pyrroline-5-carboxylate dehydrogenase